MDKKYIYQVSVRSWIENELGTEIMIPVFGQRLDNGYDIFIQSFLLPIDMIESEMENDTYNAHNMKPGIMVYGLWEDDEKVYHRWGNDDGFEPIVITRDFDGLKPDSIEIIEEFRLLFNLYYNAQKDEYIDLSNGEEITVVKINSSGFITIHKTYLKTFLAVKEKVMLIHIDSRCTLIDDTIKLNDYVLPYKDNNTLLYTLSIGNAFNGLKRENYSYIYAKKIITGCNLCDSNIWPYNEKRTYIEYIIGVDDAGKEIKYTCNPNMLSNYLGANPSAPHYLTPVYFDAAVLGKYYSNPEKYKVEDGMIRCGTLWSLYIDNNTDGYVSAYLGDLGRYLPSEQEQHYWRGFNKAIGGKLSQAKLKRDFMSIASNSDCADFVFKRTFVEVSAKFESKFGWPIFIPLSEQDQYNFESLRIPIYNSVSEMDMLVLSLVKVLIDSLNVKKIEKQLNETDVTAAGSIFKIEAWFSENGISDCEDHIKFLRELYDLRSSGSGHLKGKKYKKICKELDVQDENYAETFTKLLICSTNFLEFVENNIENLLPK